jgi:hypothetical protein
MNNRSYSVNYCILPPDVKKKSMGAMEKKMSSFLLTKFTGSCFDFVQNNFIKM